MLRGLVISINAMEKKTKTETNAYYTTDGFPYVMGCFRGELQLNTAGQGEPPR